MSTSAMRRHVPMIGDDPPSVVLGVDSWGFAAESDRRFKRIVVRVVPPLFALSIIVPWIQLELNKPEDKVVVMQVVQLLPDPPAPVIKPKVEPEVKPVVEPTAKPIPKTESAKAITPKEPAVQNAASSAESHLSSARDVAQQSGLLRLSKQLAEVRSMNALSTGSDQPLQLEASVSSLRNQFANGDPLHASTSSGGIGSMTKGSVSASQPGANLGTRRTATVQSGIGFGSSAPTGGGVGHGAAAGRTLQDLQLAFDQSKSSFYALFHRAARETPGMEAGQVVFSLTIAADGSVTRCDIVSSSFNNPVLEEKLVQRVKLMNFGSKNVPSFTYPNYPMSFLPS